jgi:hypothetical protein
MRTSIKLIIREIKSKLPPLPKLKWPKWIPYPVSWLNALVLAGLMVLYVSFIRSLFAETIMALAYPLPFRNLTGYPRPYTGLLSLLLLVFIVILPVVWIALVHHCLHLLLTRFLPAVQSPIIGPTRGWFPGFMSWWEGVWGLCVTVAGIFFGITLAAMFADASLEQVTRIVAVAWFFCAAYLYQLFYLVELRILTVRAAKKV